MKQIFLRFGIGSKVVVAGALLISANCAWAANASCSTKAVLSTFTPVGTASGCWETDKSFTNFVVTNTSTGTGVTQNTGTVDITGSETGFTTETLNTPWTVAATFTPAATGNFSVTGSNGDVTAGTMTMLVNSSNAFITGDTSYPTPQGGANNYITSVSLATAGSSGNSAGTADSLVVKETFCIGSAACSVTVGSGNEVILTATYGNNDTTPSYTCALGTGATAALAGIVGTSCPGTTSATPITVLFATNVVTLNVSDNYVLDVHSTTT